MRAFIAGILHPKFHWGTPQHSTELSIHTGTTMARATPIRYHYYGRSVTHMYGVSVGQHFFGYLACSRGGRYDTLSAPRKEPDA